MVIQQDLQAALQRLSQQFQDGLQQHAQQQANQLSIYGSRLDNTEQTMQTVVKRLDENFQQELQDKLANADEIFRKSQTLVDQMEVEVKRLAATEQVTNGTLHTIGGEAQGMAKTADHIRNDLEALRVGLVSTNVGGESLRSLSLGIQQEL